MSEIIVSDIVSGSIDGEGIFDKLMQAIDIRLDKQFNLQRITGPDYASVYLGAMQGALQQSIAFALGKEQADKQAELLVEQALLTGQQTIVAQGQASKLGSEKSLLDQKTFTEQAQTQDTVNSLAVTGLVGKQKELYGRQSDGFLRNAEQQAVKAFTDLWSIARSTIPDETFLPHNADQQSIDVMLRKLAEGVQVTQADLNTEFVDL